MAATHFIVLHMLFAAHHVDFSAEKM